MSKYPSVQHADEAWRRTVADLETKLHETQAERNRLLGALAPFVEYISARLAVFGEHSAQSYPELLVSGNRITADLRREDWQRARDAFRPGQQPAEYSCRAVLERVKKWSDEYDFLPLNLVLAITTALKEQPASQQEDTRNAALEEAAKLVDTWQRDWAVDICCDAAMDWALGKIANTIRALKRGEGSPDYRPTCGESTCPTNDNGRCNRDTGLVK